MNKNELIKVWESFAEKNDFKLNPDNQWVEDLADGVLNNEKNHGLKFCPCRLMTKDFEKDLKIICPCNFKAQKIWKDKGECWCRLFIKR